MTDDLKTTITHRCGSLSVEQTRYYGSDPQTQTSMLVRRVRNDRSGEHVQIEITAERFHPKRTTREHGSFNLSVEQADLLINALTKLYPEVLPRMTWAEEATYFRNFYKLPVKLGKS